MANESPMTQGNAADVRQAAISAWQHAAEQARWMQPWTHVWEPDPPFDRWFTGGMLNISDNCLDRHCETDPDRIALYWEGEPGDRRELSYGQLRADVLDLTRALRTMGVGAGDRVGLHVGWLPETVTAMLACARIGAVYTFIPTPLPVESLVERLEDLGPKVLITQDGAWRRGAVLPLKAHIDDALSAVPGVETTIVVRRTGVDVNWYEGDRWYHELFTERRPGVRPVDESAAQLAADHPIAVEALANKRGYGVAVTHASARLLLSAAMVHRYGSCGTGTSWIAGDASWLATQASGVFGPLFWGQTTVLYEGALDTPNHQRAWQIIERYQVEALMLSPSAARMLREWSTGPPTATQIASLQRVTTLGERAERPLLDWFTEGVGPGHVVVADGWGQVQLGGVMRFDSPVDATQLPDPGLRIVNNAGTTVQPGHIGEVVLTAPWAGTIREVHGPAADDVIDTHWRRLSGLYATGDLARYDSSGMIEFLGRHDEVVSLSGQLVSLTEIRDVLQEHPYVHQADVFEIRPALSSAFIAAAVVVDTQLTAGRNDWDVAHALLDGVREMLGGLSRPRSVIFLDRFGDELGQAQRRDALAVVAAADRHEPARIAWSQLVAAADIVSD